MLESTGMRILYLNPGAEMGGAETALTELLAGLRQEQPDWTLQLLVGSRGPLLEEAAKLGVRTEVLEMPGPLSQAGDSAFHTAAKGGAVLRVLRAMPAFYNYGRALASRVKSFEPHIIHATGFKMQVLAALFAQQTGQILWHIHDYVGWRPLTSRLLRVLAGRCAGALANSDSVLEDLNRQCPGLPWTKRLYNAVDSATLNSGEAWDLDAEAGAPPPPPGVVRIGLVATYAKWKGHETFLDALSRLPSDLPWRGYIVGGAIYKTAGSQHTAAELSKAIGARRLEDRVFLTGFLQRRGAIMRGLDVVVHSSTKPEPFGMVVVEGMACGRAVVASRGGGAAELFEEGVTALGHQPGDSADLARAIRHLLERPELRRALGERARIYADCNFNRLLLAKQLTEAYWRAAKLR
jgi:glycosyltransferase involved in cell wall biosynthesis